MGQRKGCRVDSGFARSHRAEVDGYWRARRSVRGEVLSREDELARIERAVGEGQVKHMPVRYLNRVGAGKL